MDIVWEVTAVDKQHTIPLSSSEATVLHEQGRQESVWEGINWLARKNGSLHAVYAFPKKMVKLTSLKIVKFLICHHIYFLLTYALEKLSSLP